MKQNGGQPISNRETSVSSQEHSQEGSLLRVQDDTPVPDHRMCISSLRGPIRASLSHTLDLC